MPALPLAAARHTYLVNSTLDEPDADPSLGACVSPPSGRCTLRAAIMAANFVAGPNTIVLPAGTYTLARPGTDDSALVGDLDIAHDLTLFCQTISDWSVSARLTRRLTAARPRKNRPSGQAGQDWNE